MADDDDMFKQEIKPAPWVMPGQAAMAREVYARALEKYREIKRGLRKPLPNIVPYDIRMRGIIVLDALL